MELRTWGGGGFRALCVQWGEESRFSWDRDLHRSNRRSHQDYMEKADKARKARLSSSSSSDK
ncbi:hypothetical protein Bca4012_050696 [Brassica carinata]